MRCKVRDESAAAIHLQGQPDWKNGVCFQRKKTGIRVGCRLRTEGGDVF
jgi:hypothetical protein